METCPVVFFIILSIKCHCLFDRKAYCSQIIKKKDFETSFLLRFYFEQNAKMEQLYKIIFDKDLEDAKKDKLLLFKIDDGKCMFFSIYLYKQFFKNKSENAKDFQRRQDYEKDQISRKMGEEFKSIIVARNMLRKVIKSHDFISYPPENTYYFGFTYALHYYKQEDLTEETQSIFSKLQECILRHKISDANTLVILNVIQDDFMNDFLKKSSLHRYSKSLKNSLMFWVGKKGYKSLYLELFNSFYEKMKDDNINKKIKDFSPKIDQEISASFEISKEEAPFCEENYGIIKLVVNIVPLKDSIMT